MYEGVGVKALLVKHLNSTKEIEDFDELMMPHEKGSLLMSEAISQSVALF